jgi:hypothetical protein
MRNDQEVREVLLEQDQEYRRLAVQHENYEIRLRELTGHPYPTGDDEFEKARIKKMKLQVKDQMEGILRRHLTPRLVSNSATIES